MSNSFTATSLALRLAHRWLQADGSVDYSSLQAFVARKSTQAMLRSIPDRARQVSQ
jgi:hypothetical protein